MELIIRNTTNQPIYDQIYSQIKAQIIAGKLSPGEALPSIRALAKDLRISVITTKRAYEELERDGFLENVPGKGCFVAPQNRELLREAQLRRVNNLIFRRIGQISRANGVEAVTPMHGWIMEYLYRNSDTPVFQRDIEREFSITRSTVTNILQLMERKGYIARQSVAQDARLKQLVLTEKGRQFHENTMLALHQTDEYVASLLTEEENTELLRLLNKLYLGLK